MQGAENELNGLGNDVLAQHASRIQQEADDRLLDLDIIHQQPNPNDFNVTVMKSLPNHLRMCAGCVLAPRNTINNPCRCFALCKDCAALAQVCPVCTTAVTGFVRVSLTSIHYR